MGKIKTIIYLAETRSSKARAKKGMLLLISSTPARYRALPPCGEQP